MAPSDCQRHLRGAPHSRASGSRDDGADRAADVTHPMTGQCANAPSCGGGMFATRGVRHPWFDSWRRTQPASSRPRMLTKVGSARSLVCVHETWCYVRMRVRRAWASRGSEEANAVVDRGRRNVLHTATERRLPATVADSLRMSVLERRDLSGRPINDARLRWRTRTLT